MKRQAKRIPLAKEDTGDWERARWTFLGLARFTRSLCSLGPSDRFFNYYNMIVTSMDSKGIPHPDIKDLETWSLLEVPKALPIT